MKALVWVGFVAGLGMGSACLAAGGSITQKESAVGSVELSNLGGDEDAQVVVSAPAGDAKTVTTPPAVTSPASPAIANGKQLNRKKGKGDTASEEDENVDEVAREETRGSGETSGRRASADHDVWSAGAPASGGLVGGAYMGGAASSGGSTSTTGGGSSAADGGQTTVAGNTGGSSAGGTTGGSTSTGSGSGNATGGSVLDSPEALAAKVAQYRDMMVNAPLGANGQPANPAVVRRYRMVSRAGYWSAGW